MPAFHTLRISGLILLIGTSPNTLTAQNLSGIWTGELVHDMHTRFTIEMDLVSEAGRITGTSRKALALQQEYHASMSMDGELRAGQIHLRETGITEQSGSNYRWVMQSGPLKLDTNGGRWRLYGNGSTVRNYKVVHCVRFVYLYHHKVQCPPRTRFAQSAVEVSLPS
jgi:hypothetical protein